MEALFAELTVLGFIGLVAFALVKFGVLEDVGKQFDEEELPELFETLHMALFATMVIFIIEVVLIIFAAQQNEKMWSVSEETVQSHDKVLTLLKDWEDSEEAKKLTMLHLDPEERNDIQRLVEKGGGSKSWPPGTEIDVLHEGEWLAATIEGEVKTKHVEDIRDEKGNLTGHRNPYRIELQRDIHGPDIEVPFEDAPRRIRRRNAPSPATIAQRLSYLAMRAEFVSPRSNIEGAAKLNFDFDFCDYLATIMGETLAETVEVPVSAWILLECVLATFYFVMIKTDNNMSFFSWFFGGVMWALAIFCVALTRKLDWIRRRLVSEKMMVMDMQNRRTIIRDILDGVRAETPIGSLVAITHAEYVKAMNLRIRHETRPRTHGDSKEEPAETPRTNKIAKIVRRNSGIPAEMVEQAKPLLNPSTESDAAADIDEVTGEGSTPWWAGKGITKHFVQTSRKLHEEEMYHPAPPFVKMSPPTDRSWLGHRLFGRLPNHHEALFWFDHKGPEVIYAFIRLTMLLVAIYLPAQAFLMLDIYKDAEGMDNAQAVVHVIVLFVPVFVAFYEVTQSIQKTVVVTNIELMRKKHVVSAVKGSQRTKKVMRLLKIINGLRSQAQLVLTISQMDRNTKQTDGSENIETDWKQRMNQTRKQEIEKTFDFFDEDRSGYLDAAEMTEFFKSLGEDIDADQVQKLCMALDDDGDGNVSKEEFLQWMYLSERQKTHTESIKEVAQKMFALFCPNGETEMNPQQFKDKLESLGQDIAEDDFQTFVRELDPDNDGSITVDEFIEMLERNHYSP